MISKLIPDTWFCPRTIEEEKLYVYNPPSGTINPCDFIQEVMGGIAREEELQNLYDHFLRNTSLLAVSTRKEQEIKTYSARRRSDIESYFLRVECKLFLDYDSLKSAAGQLLIYNHFGTKIFGIFPKKRIIVGLAPTDSRQNIYISSKKLALDLRKMGIAVIYLNECPEIFVNMKHKQIRNATIGVFFMLLIVILPILVIGIYLLA